MSGTMNADIARKLVQYVTTNPGKTKAEIESSVPELMNVPNWFEFACEGAKPADGFILKTVGDKVELGPIASLIV